MSDVRTKTFCEGCYDDLIVIVTRALVRYYSICAGGMSLGHVMSKSEKRRVIDEILSEEDDLLREGFRTWCNAYADDDPAYWLRLLIGAT